MKTKVLTFIILTLAISCNILNAQQIPGLNIPNINIHSPEVTSLGKYGDYLVDPSTGVVPVNIPLYTIKTAKLEFPISLSYHSSGIKVEEEASNVGLGWTLNASGVITRQIKDKPDEDGHGFLVTGKSLPYYNDISRPNFGPGIGITGYADSIKSWWDPQGVMDKEPDLFNVITPTLNGEFSCDNTGTFVSTIFDSLKYDVQLIANTLIVTDKMGIVYRFGKSIDFISAWESSFSTTSTTSLNGSSAGNPIGHESNPVSWFLTEIISADKSDTISFRYKIGSRESIRVASQSQNVVTAGSPNSRTANNFYTTLVDESSDNMQIIDRILFKNGSIQFYNATDRQDMQPSGADGTLTDTRITGFAIFDNQNNMMKNVVFDNNDYFNRTGNGRSVNDLIFGDSYFKKSLKLSGVKFYDKNNALINDYTFQYDNTSLPPRGSTALDYWGYYNGKVNPSLIPLTWYRDYWTGQPLNIGGDRSSDINYMKAASLTQITYPTGGYSRFEYEPNYYLNSSQMQGESEQIRSVSLQALQSAGRTSGCTLPVSYRTLPASNSTEFTVTDPVKNSIANLYVHFSDFEIVNNSEMTATVTDVTTGSVYSFVQNTLTMTQTKDVNQVINFYQGHTYRIDLNTNAVTGSVYGWCNSPYIEAGLSYTALVPQDTSAGVPPSQAGGLRIKSITNFDLDNKIISKKSYTYGDKLYGPNQVGIGTLITDPSKSYYNYPILLPQDGSTCVQMLYPFIWYTSNSLIDLGLNNGCAVAYSKVTERVVSTNDPDLSTGKTEYYYNNPQAYRDPLPGSKYPFDAFIYPKWGNNNLIKKIDYKLDNGNYFPVREVDYIYQPQPEKRIETLKIEEMEPEQYASFCITNGTGSSPQSLTNSPLRFFFYNFYVSGGRMLKTGEIETDFTNSGSLTTARTYSYNKYLDPAMIQTTDSKQHQIQTSLKYTGDLNYPTLITANMVSFPVMQETTIDGQVRSGSILKYNDLGLVDSRYIFTQNSTAAPISYSDRTIIPTTYERKDSFAYDFSHYNLQEIDKDNSYKTSYIWGYIGQYPIAEVRNAAEVDIACTSFEADGTGGWSVGNLSRLSGGITGNSHYSFSSDISKSGLNGSATYIVSYWSDNNSAYTIGGTVSGYPVKGRSVTINGIKWNYYEHKIMGQSTINLIGTGNIDELRLYPANAQMTSYTYAPLIGMTSQCDINNRISYFEYDGLGRLQDIKDQDGNIIKTVDYHFKGQQ